MKTDMRPQVVRWAEWLGLTAVLLGALREALIWEARAALDGPVLALIFTVAVPLLVALLVLLVTRRRSKVALGLLLMLTILAWLSTWKLGLTDGSVAFTAGAASLILQSIGLLLLVTPPSLRWLRAPDHA